MVKSGKSQITRIEVVGTLALLAVFGFFMFLWGIEGIVHNRAVQIVPDITGKSIQGALDALAPLKLALMKDSSEFNSAVPISSILRQRPPAGTKVREGKAIRVVVSQGGETVFTPSIAGLPLRNAEMMLRQSQLILGEVTESYSLRLDKGLVLSQDPQAESSVERNSLANVVVSAGPPPEGIVLMPDLPRKNVAEASQWASSVGVPLTIEKDPSSLFPYGTILAQDPQSDAVVTEDTQVKLTISGRPSDGGDSATMVSFQYQVPQGSSESLVRIVMVDQHGERELFNGLRVPGSKIDLAIPEGGHARMKIFLNGILVEERDL
ncbi:MAG: PASTA domain-containing protein [Elusimicrobiota bacterium]